MENKFEYTPSIAIIMALNRLNLKVISLKYKMVCEVAKMREVNEVNMFKIKNNLK